MNITGKRVKAIRERMGITQTELARRTGLTPATISQYESGKRTMSSRSVPKLAAVLNVTSDYLLGNVAYSEKDMLADPRVRDIIDIFSGLPTAEQRTIYQFILFLRGDK